MHLFQSNSIDIKSCMNILDVVKNIPPLLYNILLSSIVIFESKLSNGIPNALFSLPYTSLFIFKLSMMLCDVIVWRLWFRVDFLLDFVLKSLTIVFNPLLWFNTYSYTCFGELIKMILGTLPLDYTDRFMSLNTEFNTNCGKR